MSKMKDENIRQMNKVYCLNCTEKEEEIDQLQAVLAEKDKEIADLKKKLEKQHPILCSNCQHTACYYGCKWWKERAEKAEASLDRLHGQKFSDRCYYALKSRAEKAEAELQELKQVSAEVCDVCGWAMKFPTEECCKCRAEKAEARLREVYEIYAGMEGFIPETAPEGYCLMIINKMAEAAK